MIDIHTHILPDCDDGSPDIETSIKNLKMMQDAGVTDVLLTPHFLRNLYHNSADIIENRFDLLQKTILKENLTINPHKAAEVYLDSKIIADIEKENLFIGNTKYILVETSMTIFPDDLLETLYHLVRKGYRPIMAHPERYNNVIRNIGVAEDLMFRNVYLQLNAGSIIGNNGKQVQDTAWQMLENGYAHFLASDNHCHSEEYVLPKAIAEINNEFDESLTTLLTEINPRKVLNNEKIDFFYMEKEERNYPEQLNIFEKLIKKIFK